jgi:antitoxin MazE
MRTSLRAIGNSRGIILPAALLAALNLEDEVELTLQDQHILLSPVPKVPKPSPLRQGWFSAVLLEESTPQVQMEAADWDGALHVDEDWTW